MEQGLGLGQQVSLFHTAGHLLPVAVQVTLPTGRGRREVHSCGLWSTSRTGGAGEHFWRNTVAPLKNTG